LKSPDGKSLWDVGFRFTMTYNAGNTLRQTIGLIFQQDLEQVNPLFKVDVEALPWPTILSSASAHKLPIFIIGWQEDFPDPHDWLVPFASTGGNYTTWQAAPADLTKQFDSLIQAGVKETDPTKRDAIYKQFNQLYYDQATELPMVLTPGHLYFQRWDVGVYTNPLYGWLYYYPLSKN
jgi:peptide/nickel transport system substrate-binding protein